MWFWRLVCFLFGHAKIDMSLRTVGLRVCRRCLHIIDQKTVRSRNTRGDIERRMTMYPPEGYSFVDCNWKKRKAKFVSPGGLLRFVDF
jgi:hypothetical protein